MIKRRGPRTEPWGTSKVTGVIFKTFERSKLKKLS